LQSHGPDTAVEKYLSSDGAKIKFKKKLKHIYFLVLDWKWNAKVIIL